MSGQAAVAAGGTFGASPLEAADAAGGQAGGLVCADDLPDGLVIADHAAHVTVFNRAAARLTGIEAADALGGDVQEVLPLRDAEDRCWWAQTQPYEGLCTRTRHPAEAPTRSKKYTRSTRSIVSAMARETIVPDKKNGRALAK